MTDLSAQGQPSAPGAVPTPLPADIDELWERRGELSPEDSAARAEVVAAVDQIDAGEAPRDRMRAAVDQLIAYDRKRRTALLDTLERYLAERRSVIESARALFIHPNTLRQRLGRIEELTGINLDEDDLLSLELAIKLARLHGRPSEDVARQRGA